MIVIGIIVSSEVAGIPASRVNSGEEVVVVFAAEAFDPSHAPIHAHPPPCKRCSGGNERSILGEQQARAQEERDAAERSRRGGFWCG